MSVPEAAGTQALTVAGGAQIVCNSSVAASFAVFIDGSPLTGTDELRVQVLRKLQSASTLRAVFDVVLTGADIDEDIAEGHTQPLFFTIVPSAGYQFVVQLTLLVGAGTRNIEFSIERV